MVKTAEDLCDDPQIPRTIGPMEGEMPGSESGYDRALNILTETEDNLLELMTRTNPIIARACAVGYSMTASFRSSYISGRVNQVMRLAVSNGGKGREEIVRSLGASNEAFGGGPMEDSPMRTYQPAPELEV